LIQELNVLLLSGGAAQFFKGPGAQRLASSSFREGTTRIVKRHTDAVTVLLINQRKQPDGLPPTQILFVQVCQFRVVLSIAPAGGQLSHWHMRLVVVKSDASPQD
jgi:hypothetical protein